MMRAKSGAAWWRAPRYFALASAVLAGAASVAEAQLSEDAFTGVGQTFNDSVNWTPALPNGTALGDVDAIPQSSGVNDGLAIYSSTPPAGNTFLIGALEFDTNLITAADPLDFDASTVSGNTVPQTLSLQGGNTGPAGNTNLNDLITLTNNVTGTVFFRGLNGGGNGSGTAGLSVQVPLVGGNFDIAPSAIMEIGTDAYLSTASGAPTGPLTIDGGGALDLDNSNTSFSSSLVINSSTLQIGASGGISSSNVSLSSGAQLLIQSGGSISTSTHLLDNGTYNESNSIREIATLNGSGKVILNGGTLEVDAGGSFSGIISDDAPATLVVNGGTLTLSGANSYTGDTEVRPGATLTITGTGSLSASTNIYVPPAPIFPAIVAGGVTPFPVLVLTNLNFQANPNTGILARPMASLNLLFGGQVSVAAPSATGNRTVLMIGALNFAGATPFWGGLVDLSANDMVVHNGSLSNIISQIADGYNGGRWNGSAGITSSVAAGTNNTALGVELNAAANGNALLSSFDGQAVVNTDVLVKYTYFGDANLDGVVNGSDYTLIDNGFNNQLIGWRNGDFNYDGVVNGDDYTLIDNAFNTQGASLAAEPVEMVASDTAQLADAAGSSVPEPSAMSVAAIAVMRFLARRRRRISTHLTYRA